MSGDLRGKIERERGMEKEGWGDMEGRGRKRDVARERGGGGEVERQITSPYAMKYNQAMKQPFPTLYDTFHAESTHV